MEHYDIQKMQKKLRKYQDEDRYFHTLGVMYTAAALAMVHHVDLNRAQTAGLLHDCAKCIPNREKIELCKTNNIPITEFEREHPVLIHAKLGAFIAEKKYKIQDEEILQAIIWHTTGKPRMTDLEKIIFIADYVEPARCKAPNLEKIRLIAFKDLDECMYWILKDTLEYLKENPKTMDVTTEEAFSYYRELHQQKTGGTS